MWLSKYLVLQIPLKQIPAIPLVRLGVGNSSLFVVLFGIVVNNWFVENLFIKTLSLRSYKNEFN